MNKYIEFLISRVDLAEDYLKEFRYMTASENERLELSVAQELVKDIQRLIKMRIKN